MSELWADKVKREMTSVEVKSSLESYRGHSTCIKHV